MEVTQGEGKLYLGIIKTKKSQMQNQQTKVISHYHVKKACIWGCKMGVHLLQKMRREDFSQEFLVPIKSSIQIFSVECTCNLTDNDALTYCQVSTAFLTILIPGMHVMIRYDCLVLHQWMVREKDDCFCRRLWQTMHC